RRFGIAASKTDRASIYRDGDIGAVVISTPHNLHAQQVIEALDGDRHVFVEKPLCLTGEELDRIAEARASYIARNGGSPVIMAGFNRRFAPLAVQMRKAMAARQGPAFAIYTCNAGAIPADHWVQDPAVGGGRIAGEACHFIDFLRFLIESPIERVAAVKQARDGRDLEDNVAISLSFQDGSVGQVNYFACGNRSFPKEQCQASFDGKTLVLDNFRTLTGYGARAGGRSLRQDKGHNAQFQAFVSALKGGAPEPASFSDIENVMRATFAAVRAMRENLSVAVPVAP